MNSYKFVIGECITQTNNLRLSFLYPLIKLTNMALKTSNISRKLFNAIISCYYGNIDEL